MSQLINFSLLLLFLTFSCTHLQKDKFLDYPKINSSEVLNKTKLNGQKIAPLSLTATVKIEGDKGSFVFKMFILYNDKLLRIDNLTPFGHPISTLIISKNSIKIHDIEKNVLAIGQNSVENMERLSFLPLNAQELKALMSLQVPGTIKNASIYAKDGSYYFYLSKSRFRYCTFKLDSHNLLKTVSLKARNKELNIKYAKYRNINKSFYYPKKITVSSKNKKETKLTLHIKSIKQPNKIKTKQFKLNLPPNIKKIFLD